MWGVEVYPDQDHGGEPVVLVEAFYDFRDTPMDAGAMLGLKRHLKRALAEVDEIRFPILRNHFHEQLEVATGF